MPTRDTGTLPDVRRYLIRDRCLAPAQIDALIESGRLYADARRNAVFVLLAKDNRAVGAELRGTARTPWRGMAPGSRKDQGYFSVLAPGSSTIVLCESAIDAISCARIYPERLCISASGARPNPRWLAPLLDAGNEVYCGYDSDHPGQHNARALMAQHPSVKRLQPSHKDWNDLLRATHTRLDPHSLR